MGFETYTTRCNLRLARKQNKKLPHFLYVKRQNLTKSKLLLSTPWYIFKKNCCLFKRIDRIYAYNFDITYTTSLNVETREAQGAHAPPTFHKLLGKVPLCSVKSSQFLFMRVPLNTYAPRFLTASYAHVQLSKCKLNI